MRALLLRPAAKLHTAEQAGCRGKLIWKHEDHGELLLLPGLPVAVLYVTCWLLQRCGWSLPSLATHWGSGTR